MEAPLTINLVLEATTVFDLDTWYHIAASYDGSLGKIYVNGQLENSQTFATPLSNSPGGQLIIGIDRDGSSNYNQAFKGCMDEVRIWNTIKSQSEIQASMNTSLIGNENNLVAYFNMEQNGGNELLDISGNQYNGPLLGNSGSNVAPQFSDSQITLLTAQEEYTICEGEELSLSISGANEYEWSPANLFNDPFSNTPTISNLSQNTMIYVTGTSGCASETLAFTIEVIPQSQEQLNIEACPGETISYLGVPLEIGASQSFTLQSTIGCDSIINVNVTEAMYISISQEVTICEGDSIFLGNTYQNTTGEYQSILPGMNTCDTLLYTSLSILPSPAIDIGTDTTVCIGTPLIIGHLFPNASYIWQNGSTEATQNITTAGSYWVEITTLEGCSLQDTIEVIHSPIQQISLGSDTILCLGENFLIAPSLSNVDYEWQDGSTASQLIVSEPGQYWLTAQSNEFCYQSDTILVDYFQEDTLDLGEDNALCIANDSIILNPGFENASYLWQDGSTNTTFTVQSAVALGSSTFYVNVISENNCFHTDTILIGTFIPLPIDLGPDSIICPGDTMIINTGTSWAASYSWQDGSTNNNFIATEEGTYWAVGTMTDGCPHSDTMVISFGDTQTFILGNDTTLCSGEELLVGQEFLNASYSWQDGNTMPFYLINQAGQYWLTAQSEEICFVSDTISVDYFQEPVLDLGNDTTLCEGQSLLLNPNYNNATYTWQNDSTYAVFNVESQGLYSLTILTENNCLLFDDISVLYIDPLSFDLGPDLSFCPNDTVIIGQEVLDATYLWQDGSMDATYVVTTPGTYRLTLEHEECAGTVTDSIQIFHVDIVQADLGPDTVICLQEEVLLESYQMGADYIWQDSSTTAVFTAKEEGLYWVTTLYENCLSYDSIYIQTIDCTICNLYIPNAFSPNFDGINDNFELFSNCKFQSFELKIFDRWGAEIFSSNDVTNTWNGTFKGKDALNGVYTYTLLFNFIEGTDLEKKILSGDISIIK